MNHFKFKPLKQDDLTLLYQWFQEPTINHWYAKEINWSQDEIKKKYEPRLLGHEPVPSFIVSQDNTPLGFIQYYALTDCLPDGIDDYNHPIFKQYQPKDLAGIDLFIASSTVRGKGLGALLINQFIVRFLTQFKAIIVDPNINNINAINCFKKAGFTETNYRQDSNHLVMIKPLGHLAPLIKSNLNNLKNDINYLLGFYKETPRINYGPCGIFAKLFFDAWNRRFKDKVHIVFVMMKDKEECWHIAIRLPTGELYDGGVGIHSDEIYGKDYTIEDMYLYNHEYLEKWSYGLDRTYPRFCPNFEKDVVNELIQKYLDNIVEGLNKKLV